MIEKSLYAAFLSFFLTPHMACASDLHFENPNNIIRFQGVLDTVI